MDRRPLPHRGPHQERKGQEAQQEGDLPLSGDATLLLEQSRKLNPGQVKERLMMTASKSFPDSAIQLATSPAVGFDSAPGNFHLVPNSGALRGTDAVWRMGAIWGTQSLQGFGAVWRTGAIWGTSAISGTNSMVAFSAGVISGKQASTAIHGDK